MYRRIVGLLALGLCLLAAPLTAQADTPIAWFQYQYDNNIGMGTFSCQIQVPPLPKTFVDSSPFPQYVAMWPGYNWYGSVVGNDQYGDTSGVIQPVLAYWDWGQGL